MTQALDYITALEGTPNKVKIAGQELTLLEVKMPSGTDHGPWFSVRVRGVHWFEDGEYDFDGKPARLHSRGVVSTPGMMGGANMHAYTDLYVRFVEDKP